MEEEKSVALQEANTINQEAAVEEDSKIVAESAEGDEPEALPSKPTPVPTLYIHNLTDKIKIQGKFESLF